MIYVIGLEFAKEPGRKNLPARMKKIVSVRNITTYGAFPYIATTDPLYLDKNKC